MTGDGGFFSASGAGVAAPPGIGDVGLMASNFHSHGEIADAADPNQLPGGKPPRQARGCGATRRRATTEQKAEGASSALSVSGEGGPDVPPIEVQHVKAVDVSKKLVKSLSKHSGECRALLLQMKAIDASDSLVTSLESIGLNMEQAFNNINKMVSGGVCDDSALLPYNENAEGLIDFYLMKKQYASSFLGISKRQEKAVLGN